jgi:VIT1/CCC1 family predicted Fe2+/Mn2+ transporter
MAPRNNQDHEEGHLWHLVNGTHRGSERWHDGLRRAVHMHGEKHRGERSGWLRAAVLGGDDGIVSTASLMIGVAAASASQRGVLIAGVAGLVAGAMSMAVGEYVSVSSQRDTEEADILRETEEIAASPEAELLELASIYEKRGVERDLAMKVAQQLSAVDVLGAHARDELGHLEASRARPLQAALVSAASFAIAAFLPILAMGLAPSDLRIPFIAGAALCGLGVLGAVGGHLGGAPRMKASIRVLLGGILAMGITALVGKLFGAVVS